MKIHANAALTVKQRQEVKRLFETGQFTKTQLAKQFTTSTKTIGKWVDRSHYQDRSSAPHLPAGSVTDAFRQAVIAYRQAHPWHGPVRIAAELEADYGHFATSTVYLILRQAGLTRPAPAKRAKPSGIPVGRYRTQMDVQQLPAIKGSSGFEYKISIIHLSTRMKYSEIHDNYQSATLAAVYERSLERLPPFLSLSPTMP
ncbi:hypothetical protein [Nibrella saemangeumensis]